MNVRQISVGVWWICRDVRGGAAVEVVETRQIVTVVGACLRRFRVFVGVLRSTSLFSLTFHIRARFFIR